MNLCDMLAAVRQLDTIGERMARVPMLVTAIGGELDTIEGRLRQKGEYRGIPLELTDVTQRAGGNWHSRTGTINGLGDVAPLLEQMSGAIGRVWDAIGLLNGNVDDAERSRAKFERRFNAAPNLDRLDVLADVLDTLKGVVDDIDEWAPQPPPPATRAKGKPVAAAA